MLEKLLAGTASPRLKSRALYVLAQINTPRAREVLTSIAKGSSIPELQSRAIQYLGAHGGRESRADAGRDLQLVDRRRREAPHPARLRARPAKKTACWRRRRPRQNPELRAEAVRQLGAMGANEELWQMYQKETSVDVKRQILSAMQASGNTTRMVEIAQDREGSRASPPRRPEPRRHGRKGGRRRAGRDLRNREGSGDPPDQVINALFTSGQRHRARRPRPQRAGHGDEDGDRASGCRTWTTKRRRPTCWSC